MGSLKPGAIYTYEREGSVTYAREVDSTERRIVGWDIVHNAFQSSIHSEDEECRKWKKKYEDEALWEDIRHTAETNESLQKAIDHVIMIYRLSKTDPK